MTSGNATEAATYSFSSQPKVVTGTRKKYRDPGELDISMYRDLKETCIMWDKRVHRGNTYSMYTQNAIKEALQDATQESPVRARPRRKAKEPNIFDMPLPEKERVAVDLTQHLTAKEIVVEVDTAEAQTDEFLPEPPKEQYRPQKTGIDASTQVEDGELFDFDAEVAPLLDVLINKTLEQSIMEVEEEHELSSMEDFKEKWHKRQAAMMKDWQAQVEEERQRWKLKEQIVQQRRLVKEREAQVLLKMQAVAAAKRHLRNLVPNAVADLKEMAFPDVREMAISRLFVPELLSNVRREVKETLDAERDLRGALRAGKRAQGASRAAAVAEQRRRQKELERRHYEEMQIRQGKIRVLIEDATGATVSVGPVQVSSQDFIDALQDRVHKWLSANRPDLATAFPHGVLLLLEGKPVVETKSIFGARAGQLSMVPKPEPPPPAAEEAEEGEGESDAEG